MSAQLDEDYFLWLCSHVVSIKPRSRARPFWRLLRQLHEKEYVGWLPNDVNRMREGQLLRHAFCDEKGLPKPEEDDPGCSMLEMLLAVSGRLSFETERRSKWWFWHLMKNIGLENYSDDVRFSQEEVDDILDCIIWRTYSPSGQGGLFPLEDPQQDQRTVELWFQLNAYLLERY